MHAGTPEIAIVDADTLTCIGLRSLIERMMPQAVIRTFNTFAQLMCDTPDAYVHYFISAQVLMEHSTFFVERKHKTIVLTHGTTGVPQLSNFHTLNVELSEEKLVRALLQLQQTAHSHGRNLPDTLKTRPSGIHHEDPNGLSRREVEVLVKIVSGLTNKEIAEKLHISTTTVISHRKNLMEKLHVRSVSGLTIYAVMNGHIEADRI